MARFGLKRLFSLKPLLKSFSDAPRSHQRDWLVTTNCHGIIRITLRSQRLVPQVRGMPADESHEQRTDRHGHVGPPSSTPSVVSAHPGPVLGTASRETRIEHYFGFVPRVQTNAVVMVSLRTRIFAICPTDAHQT